MSFDRRLAAALAAPALMLSVSGCGINSIPTAEENAKARWADVEADYQRRADLIPNLVETVKGFAAQERAVLIGVTEARAKATATPLAATDLTDPAKVEAYETAQNGLTTALTRFRSTFTVENYPELASSGLFKQLMDETASTENEIKVSRRDYNDAVQKYNTEIRTFPAVIGAKIIYGSKPMTPFKAAPGAETAPKVSF